MNAVSSAVVMLLLALISSTSRGQAPEDTGYSAAGLYNLANSYVRAGKPGMAVLNYERAALLAPDDADIQANLNHVRASQHLPPQASNGFARAIRLVSPSSAAWIGVLGILLAGASLLLGTASLRFRAPGFRALRLAGIVLGLSALGFGTCNALVQWPKLHEAVVIVKETAIRVSPVPMGDPLQQLMEAETVTITAQHEDFVLIRTADGRSGWVASADVADVVPSKSVR